MLGRVGTWLAAALVLGLALTSAWTSPVVTASDASEELFIDTFEDGDDGAAGPVFTSQPLAAGWDYQVTIQGTFSIWNPPTWSDAPVICGAPEDEPLFPSPAVENGMVGLDPEWVFAVPNNCEDALFDVPSRHGRLEFSLDGGISWAGLTPSVEDRELHRYEWVIPGDDARLGVRLVDDRTVDNYGRLRVTVQALPRAVEIDIKPGSDPNSISLDSQGVTPVAILSSPDFDAPALVDRESVRFGQTGSEESLAFCRGTEDVNDDGLPDVVCHFFTQRTGFASDTETGWLTATTPEGLPLVGNDSVRIVPGFEGTPVTGVFAEGGFEAAADWSELLRLIPV